MTKEEIFKADDEFIMHTYKRNPIAIESGKGATVRDKEGKSYIDFTSGIGVCSLGYGNEKWAKAIYDQAKKLGHISNLYYSEPCVELARKLVERSGLERVFFANSGAEANEGMIKIARKYSYDKYGEGRSTIITLVNSFHGRTITTLKATGQEHFHEFFNPFTEGFRYAEANDIESLGKAAGDDVCAVMVELIQGEGGVNPLDVDYVKAVADLCSRNDWLLLIDEVQTGIGRTGAFFCYQNYGIKPDVVSFAKGIAGGMPFGGFIAGSKAKDTLGYGTHGSTFGGNPMAAAAANVVVDTLTPEFLESAKEKGDYLRKAIEEIDSPYIAGVRGMGLMIGVGIKGKTHAEVKDELQKEGLLALTAGKDTLRLLPPLVIEKDEMDKGLEILRKVLSRQ